MATVIRNPHSTFIHIPKNGSTSICNWLQENTDSYEVKRRHSSATELREKYGKLGFTFCVVRNPWDRIVSMFHYNIQEPEKRIAEIKNYNGIHPKSHKLRWQLKYNQQVVAERKEITFDEFVSSKNWFDIKLQQDYHENVDYVMRLENIQTDFKKIQEVFNCNKPLPVKNSTKHKKYQDYYSDKTKDIVFKYFESDIKLYGYEF